MNVDRIANAIRADLIRKGLTETSNNPDLMVNAVTILKDKQSTTANTNYYVMEEYTVHMVFYGGM